jgi:hypothetical protein
MIIWYNYMKWIVRWSGLPLRENLIYNTIYIIMLKRPLHLKYGTVISKGFYRILYPEVEYHLLYHSNVCLVAIKLCKVPVNLILL